MIFTECMGYQDTFQTIETCLRNSLGDDFRSLFIAIIDPEAENFYFLLQSHALPFHYFKDKYPLSDNLISYAIDNLTGALLIPDPVAYCAEKKLQPPDYAESLALVPLVIHKKTKGVTGCFFHSLGASEENPFLRFLDTLGKNLSLILEKLHQYEIMTQSLVEMQAISEIGVRMYQAKKLDVVLREIIDNVIEKLGFDRVLIALIDDKTHKLVGRITRGYEDVLHLVDYPVSTSHDVLAEVARSGKTIIIEDIRNDRRIPEEIRKRSDIWQCAYVPLMSSEGRIWGALSADHKVNRGQITLHRLQVLEEFARHAGIAIANARLYEHVEHISQVDGLTGVYNRQYFDGVMQREIPRVKRYNHPLSLLMIDICDFKDFNDKYGHVVGDEILRKVARLLMENVRETDIVARYGGDEFVVLMPDTSETQAKMVQERIERAVFLHNSRETESHKQFRLSPGLKSASSHNVDSILVEADRAMYKGKASHIKESLLHALISSDAQEVERWDKFIANILRILGEKEPHFNSHSRRVMNYAVKICQILGLDPHFLETMSLAALIHDIGKISISAEILRSTSHLTNREYEIVKTHPAMGVDLLKGTDHLKEVREIIYCHHERWDGRAEGVFPGYPQGLSGDQIPLGSRILKVADSYDAMTSLRPYSTPMPPNEAIAEVLSEQGKSFDPQIVRVFVPYLRTITSSLSASFPLVQDHFTI
ncbi:diguanylate cyclase [Candidatus Sumerlaeota bacterium]|nr:diguanylate cyclase [Candidatus Sumerlaeota bacterium]